MGTGQGHGLNDPFEPCEKTSCGYCEREILEEEIPEENKSMPRTNRWVCSEACMLGLTLSGGQTKRQHHTCESCHQDTSTSTIHMCPTKHPNPYR